ncbi:MAG: VOC family protein [Actinobacteria bacterium]|nr:VOC family protein [Actinomycetota bacterium]
MNVVNHVGLCATDLEVSTRFYVGSFGFTVRNELVVPDAFTAGLLGVTAPVGLTARYLVLDGFVLELLWFDRPGNDPPRDRGFTEPGLTHLSFGVADLEATARLVTEFGGTVLDARTIPGAAVMVRDPDGQVIELLPTAHTERTSGGSGG